MEKIKQQLANYFREHFDFLVLSSFVIFISYVNSLNVPFISDDLPTYLYNPIIRNFSSALSTLNLYDIINAILFFLFKLSLFPLHLVSIFLHFVAVLLAHKFFRTFLDKKTSTMAAVLFAAHPLATEPTVWLSGRPYLIMTIITLLTLLLFHSNKKLLALTLYSVFVILSQSPQGLVTIPILLIYSHLMKKEKFNIYSLWLATLPIMFFLYRKSQILQRVIETQSQEGSANYFLRLIYSSYKAVANLVLPNKLSLYHEGEVLTQTKVFGMAIVLVVLMAFSIYLAKKQKTIFYLILMIFSSIAFVYSPKQVSWFIADRYLYTATAFFCAILAIFLNSKKLKKASLPLFFAILTAYSITTIVRNSDWKSDKSLWNSVIREYPLSTRAYNNLGDVYSREGDYATSIKMFSRAVEINPNYVDAQHNLGLTYLRAGILDKAEFHLKKSIELAPNLYNGYLHLGILEYTRKNNEKALEYLQKALELNPTNTEIQNMIKSLTQAP